MVQEVQTWVWITNETTLETIEAIGTSSFKIVEWRQTKWAKYAIGCEATWTASWSLSENNRDTWTVKSKLSLTSSYGKQDFVISNGWVRFPTPWTYTIAITWRWGGSSLSATVTLNLGGTQIYTKTFSGGAGTDTWSKNIDVGKFDLLEMYTRFYYSWSGSASGWFVSDPVITITQL